MHKKAPAKIFAGAGKFTDDYELLFPDLDIAIDDFVDAGRAIAHVVSAAFEVFFTATITFGRGDTLFENAIHIDLGSIRCAKVNNIDVIPSVTVYLFDLGSINTEIIADDAESRVNIYLRIVIGSLHLEDDHTGRGGIRHLHIGLKLILACDEIMIEHTHFSPWLGGAAAFKRFVVLTNLKAIFGPSTDGNFPESLTLGQIIGFLNVVIKRLPGPAARKIIPRSGIEVGKAQADEST
jgi:hypothetical protein